MNISVFETGYVGLVGGARSIGEQTNDDKRIIDKSIVPASTGEKIQTAIAGALNKHGIAVDSDACSTPSSSAVNGCLNADSPLCHNWLPALS